MRESCAWHKRVRPTACRATNPSVVTAYESSLLNVTARPFLNRYKKPSITVVEGEFRIVVPYRPELPRGCSAHRDGSGEWQYSRLRGAEVRPTQPCRQQREESLLTRIPSGQLWLESVAVLTSSSASALSLALVKWRRQLSHRCIIIWAYLRTDPGMRR